MDGLKYANSHEWVKHEGSVATIGITDHAQVLFLLFLGLYLSRVEPNSDSGFAMQKLEHWFGSCKMSLYQLIYT